MNPGHACAVATSLIGVRMIDVYIPVLYNTEIACIDLVTMKNWFQLSGRVKIRRAVNKFGAERVKL